MYYFIFSTLYTTYISIAGGGGGVERDQILDPPKNQISDVRPPPPKKKSNIRYHMFAENQISGLKNHIHVSDITPPKNQISDIKVPPFHPPPPTIADGISLHVFKFLAIGINTAWHVHVMMCIVLCSYINMYM